MEDVLHLFASNHVLLRVPAGFFFLCRTLCFGGLMLIFVYLFHTNNTKRD